MKANIRDWQDIKTAPKNSTIIDIWSERNGRLCDYFREELSGDNVFYSPLNSGVCVIRDATHWMPIPKSPKKL